MLSCSLSSAMSMSTLLSVCVYVYVRVFIYEQIRYTCVNLHMEARYGHPSDAVGLGF